ncbi:hypothetical protein [Mycolicibacterium vanbaalenii]|uniref:hypothetical protein n=1 Tax=Mycolicibacterium vanbaalenii TaxID=110539 RepID=UPI001F19A274|nr:hypothetical protein [Mycolicibacterium vanbaalenii]
MTQKKPKSITPTLRAAPMWRARWTGSPPWLLRRSAPAVAADWIASRSARAVETGTGAGAVAAPLAADMGATPGPVAAAGATPGPPGAGAPGGGGVVGGPSGIGGAGLAPLAGGPLTGAAPAPPDVPPPPAAPGEAAPPGGGAAAAWLVGAGAGAGDVAGADDASGGWDVSGCSGAVGLADLAVSAGVAFGLTAPAPVGGFDAEGESDGPGLDEPEVAGEGVGPVPPDDDPDELIGLADGVDEPDGVLGLGPAEPPTPAFGEGGLVRRESIGSGGGVPPLDGVSWLIPPVPAAPIGSTGSDAFWKRGANVRISGRDRVGVSAFFCGGVGTTGGTDPAGGCHGPNLGTCPLISLTI